FTKPAALTVRLFANMMGGHIIVIVLTLLIFILGALGAAAAGGTLVVSLIFSVFMLLIDVLVSFIQAYVFTMLSTVFIGLAQEDGHHGKDAHEVSAAPTTNRS
ncbi:MAG: F0F1 ATP synthase subunit A, partial [Muribaculum intestinale]|nr:F0F1 ATP synthase subunit A [Muribaculum intestinale]